MMKRFLIILVMLFWCSVSSAEIIELSCNPKSFGELDPNWIYEYFESTIDTEKKTYIVKSKGYYKIKGNKEFVDDLHFSIIKIDETSITYTGLNNPEFINKFNYGSDFKDIQIEPKPNFVGWWDLNCKSDKVEIASMIDKAKNTCKELGFTEGTDKFADCSLKLYTQSVELAAKQNQQVVMQPQSSGSNVMTIYDPVRDSRALIRQGQRMLSGACTLGINC